MKRFAGIASVVLIVMCTAAGQAQPPDLLGGGGKPDVAPLNGLTGRLNAALGGGGKAASTSTAATHFTPAGKRLSMDTFINGLTKDPEQQKALRQVLTQVFTAYETEAKKSGFENDVAGALAFYITAHYSIFHDGQEVPDATTIAIARQLQGALNTPAMRQASNADKQKLYEFCVMLAGFTTVSYAAPDTDTKTKQGLKTLAGQALTYMLKVAPERVAVGDDGLHITGDTAVAESPAAQPNPTTVPSRGGTAGSVADISYSLPAGWSEQKAAGAITLGHSMNDFYDKRSITVVLSGGYSHTGSLQDAFRSAWKETVEPTMVGTDGKPVELRAYVRRLPSGMNCCFDQFTMQTRDQGTRIDVRLYLIENGDKVYPVLVLLGGIYYKYEDALESFVDSYRVRGMVPARPLVTVKQLAGTWSYSSASIANRVNRSTGQIVGDASIATAETLTLNSDGTYRSSYTGYNSGAAFQQNNTGTFKIEGDLLIMTSKRGQVEKKQFLGLGRTEDGKTRMILLTPGTQLTFGNIGLYGNKYVLKTE